MSAELSAIQAHWNQRASLGETAGTQDLILKELEQRAILAEIRGTAPMHVLEVGCGRGETARRVLEACPAAFIDAVDASEAMIHEARQGSPLAIDFRVGDVLALPPLCALTVAYSQRCLINLPTWELQKQAIDHIASRLEPNGRFLMCEHSQDGLDAINDAREWLVLSPITPPWHNRYLRDDELKSVTSLRLLRCVPFSATYYVLSRLINAKHAQQDGIEPRYDARVNQLALTLPADVVDAEFAQGRLWVWEKA